MKFVELKNIDKIYKTGKIEFKALDSVSLEIERGDFIVFAGPSGSGKTTLLNIVGAMDKVTDGKIYIDGINIGELSKREASKFRRDRLGFIFQSYNLIPVLTAYENIELSLDLIHRGNKKEKRERIERIMELTGIAELRNRRPWEMSGGQQQRVAIARALVKEPEIVLADEPTANLDSKTGTAIIDLMKKLNDELNITFIFSSHDKSIIDRAKRVINLKDGKTVI